MSFTLPLTCSTGEKGLNYDHGENPLSEKKQADSEKDQVFERHKKELENIVAKQKERIRALRTSTGVEIECYEGTRRAQLKSEKEQLLSEIAQKKAILKESSARLRDERWISEQEIQWGETRSNLAHTMHDLTDLQAEIKESKRQLEVLESLETHRKEKAQTVRKELQQTRDHVKWLLECQIVDEVALKGRVREEELYLEQLVEVRDTMQKEVHQLSRQEELEILPLKEEADILEEYLEEMQKITQDLEIQCEGLRLQTDEAQLMRAGASEESVGLLPEQHCIENIDQDLISILTEEITAAHKRGVIPISVNAQKDEWLRNYYVVWSRIQQQCEKMLHDIKPDVGEKTTEARRRIESLQHRLDEVTGRHSGEALERRTALLAMENLLHLMHGRRQSESVMMRRIDEIASQLGVQAEPYVSLVKMEGYDDILNEYDDETVIPTESYGGVFDALLEESPEEAVNELTSMAEVAPDDDSGAERLRRTAHRPRGNLQEFIQQKAFFLSDQASRVHLPLRSTKSKDSPPESVEDALSQIQERLLKEVVSFVKTRKQKTIRWQTSPLQETVVPDPDYPREAQEVQARIERFLDERQKASSAVNDERHVSSSHDSVSLHSFRRILVKGARVPSDVLAASPFVQAKYFLSCAIRGFTAVVLTPEIHVTCVRQLFLSRDMNRLYARDVRKLATEGNSRDVFVKVENIRDVLLETNTRLTGSKLKAELSFVIVVQAEGNSEVYWIIQSENNESRHFWAYVIAWVANETSPRNRDAIVTHLKAENKVFVLDSAGSTAENTEPSERGTLRVQVVQD